MKPFVLVCLMLWTATAWAAGPHITDPGPLPPIDSATTLKVGDPAPDFSLPSIQGGLTALSDYRGKKQVLISFVPAAFTPVCSEQWPGYALMESFFTDCDAVILGITVDNTPSQKAWVHDLGGLWFPVLSDFHPHGETAKKYGVLRSSGVSERALFLVDKRGMLTYIHVGDINKRPDLDGAVKAMRCP